MFIHQQITEPLYKFVQATQFHNKVPPIQACHKALQPIQMVTILTHWTFFFLDPCLLSSGAGPYDRQYMLCVYTIVHFNNSIFVYVKAVILVQAGVRTVMPS